MDQETERHFGLVRDDIAEIRADVKTLLAFKWQIIGGSMALSGFISFVVTVIGLAIKK